MRMKCAVSLAPVVGKASGNNAFTLKDFLCQDMLSYALIQDGENKKLIWLLSKHTAVGIPRQRRLWCPSHFLDYISHTCDYSLFWGIWWTQEILFYPKWCYNFFNELEKRGLVMVKSFFWTNFNSKSIFGAIVHLPITRKKTSQLIKTNDNQNLLSWGGCSVTQHSFYHPQVSSRLLLCGVTCWQHEHPWEFVGNTGAQPSLWNSQNLHCKKISGWQPCTGKFKKHSCTLCK